MYNCSKMPQRSNMVERKVENPKLTLTYHDINMGQGRSQTCQLSVSDLPVK